jgi:hypothetical protein
MQTLSFGYTPGNIPVSSQLGRHWVVVGLVFSGSGNGGRLCLVILSRKTRRPCFKCPWVLNVECFALDRVEADRIRREEKMSTKCGPGALCGKLVTSVKPLSVIVHRENLPSTNVGQSLVKWSSQAIVKALVKGAVNQLRGKKSCAYVDRKLHQSTKFGG